MGWFSDKLFGERKSIDQNKINSYMAAYEGMIPEQENIARGLMDEDSALNRGWKTRFMQQQRDQMALTQRKLQDTAAMTGSSPAQMMMQQRMAANQQQGQFGDQWQGLLNNRWQQGFNQLGNVMQLKKGVGERLSQAHINQVNAANAARASRMSTTMGLLGTAASFMGGGMGGAAGGGGMNLANIGSGGGVAGAGTGLFGREGGFMSNFGTGGGALSNMFGG